MSMNHMIKFHVLIPVGVFVVALFVGVPVGTAFVVAMMSACAGMMLMMVSGGHEHRNHEHAESPEREV